MCSLGSTSCNLSCNQRCLLILDSPRPGCCSAKTSFQTACSQKKREKLHFYRVLFSFFLPEAASGSLATRSSDPTVFNLLFMPKQGLLTLHTKNSRPKFSSVVKSRFHSGSPRQMTCHSGAAIRLPGVI